MRTLQINGMVNAVQGMTGGTNNIYSVEEQKKIQSEYAKQQMGDSEK